MIAKEKGGVPVTGPVHVWEGQLSGLQGKADHSTSTASMPASAPNFPWLKKDLPPATAKDDDSTIQWGGWSGTTDFEESNGIDEDELRAAVGLPTKNLGC